MHTSCCHPAPPASSSTTSPASRPSPRCASARARRRPPPLRRHSLPATAYNCKVCINVPSWFSSVNHLHLPSSCFDPWRPSNSPRQLIAELVKIRQAAGLNARSKATVRKAVGDVYAHTVDDKVRRPRSGRVPALPRRPHTSAVTPARKLVHAGKAAAATAHRLGEARLDVDARFAPEHLFAPSSPASCARWRSK